MTTLLTIQQAADLMGVSRKHVDRLIDEAQTCPKTAKWREKRDFVDLSIATSKHRCIRVRPDALGIPLQPQAREPVQL
jgi:predicted DNA-binding transcriptional regulator AlpA